eukprot:jgi/Mesen1/6517/ME000332S05528
MPSEVLDITREYLEGLWRGDVSDKRLCHQLLAWKARGGALGQLKSMKSMKSPNSKWGILAGVMDRFTAIKAGNVCVRIPKENNDGRDPHDMDMHELDYETVLAILERCKARATEAGGVEEEPVDAKLPEEKTKKEKKEVIPDIATRSIFMRFGETPTNVQLAVKKVEEKKRVGRDAQMLKGMLEKMGLTLTTVGQQLQDLKENQSTIDGRLKKIEQSGLVAPGEGSASRRTSFQ